MPVMGLLTNLLKPEYQAQAYALAEDEDFLTLWRDGKCIAVFSTHMATIEMVEKRIETRES